VRAEATSVGFRLRSVRGHLDGVIRMVDEDRYCVDLLHQLSAVQGALDRIRREILEGHLRGCLADAVAEGTADELVDELLTAAFRTVPAHRSPNDRCRTEDGACAHAG